MHESPNARASRVVSGRDVPAAAARMVRFSDGLDATHRNAAPAADPAGASDAMGPEPLVRRALHDLRVESELRRRSVPDAPVAQLATPGDSASDPLVRLLAELRAVTTRYVVGLRAEGAPPEQMLVRVKAMVRAALAAEGWRDPESTRSLTDAVVGWSIDAYYDR